MMLFVQSKPFSGMRMGQRLLKIQTEESSVKKMGTKRSLTGISKNEVLMTSQGQRRGQFQPSTLCECHCPRNCFVPDRLQEIYAFLRTTFSC